VWGVLGGGLRGSRRFLASENLQVVYTWVDAIGASTKPDDEEIAILSPHSENHIPAGKGKENGGGKGSQKAITHFSEQNLRKSLAQLKLGKDIFIIRIKKETETAAIN
jgi:hypothetical protein